MEKSISARALKKYYIATTVINIGTIATAIDQSAQYVIITGIMLIVIAHSKFVRSAIHFYLAVAVLKWFAMIVKNTVINALANGEIRPSMFFSH